MNRLWLIAGVILSMLLLTPAFSQTEDDALSPGEEPVVEDADGEDASTETATEEKTEDEGAPESSAEADDAERPAVLWQDPESGNIYATSSVKFILEATDNISELDYIEYKIDNREFRRYTGPISITEQGPASITYRSVDRAGNKEVDRVYNVTIDDNGPVIRVLPSQGFIERDGKRYSAPGNTFTMRAVDEYSGVKSVRYAVNSSTLQDYQTGSSVQLTNSGTQLVNWSAEDNLGNQTVGSLLVEVDGSAPVLEIKPTQPLTKVGDTQYARRNTGFRVDATDAGSGISSIMVRIDGASEWQAYTDPIFFDSEQPHSIEAKAVDGVGNESETKTIRFVVDDDPPVTELKTSVE